jgi:hypothetical protein
MNPILSEVVHCFHRCGCFQVSQVYLARKILSIVSYCQALNTPTIWSRSWQLSIEKFVSGNGPVLDSKPTQMQPPLQRVIFFEGRYYPRNRPLQPHLLRCLMGLVDMNVVRDV